MVRFGPGDAGDAAAVLLTIWFTLCRPGDTGESLPFWCRTGDAGDAGDSGESLPSW